MAMKLQSIERPVARTAAISTSKATNNSTSKGIRRKRSSRKSIRSNGGSGEVLVEWKRNVRFAVAAEKSLGNLDWHHSSGSNSSQPQQQLSPKSSGRKTLDQLLEGSTAKLQMSLKNVWSGITGMGEEEPEHPAVTEKWGYDYSQEYQQLQYQRADVVSLVTDEAAFQTLKRSLQKRHCVTNGYLKQTIHQYVRHVKDVRARNAQRMEQYEMESQRQLQINLHHTEEGADQEMEQPQQEERELPELECNSHMNVAA